MWILAHSVVFVRNFSQYGAHCLASFAQSNTAASPRRKKPHSIYAVVLKEEAKLEGTVQRSHT